MPSIIIHAGVIVAQNPDKHEFKFHCILSVPNCNARASSSALKPAI